MGNQRKVETGEAIAWVLQQQTPISKKDIAKKFSLCEQWGHYILLEIAGYAGIWLCNPRSTKGYRIASTEVLEHMEGEPAWMQKEVPPPGEAVNKQQVAQACQQYPPKRPFGWALNPAANQARVRPSRN